MENTTQQTENKSTRELALYAANNWADNMTISEWAKLSEKYFGTKGIRNAKMDDESTLHIYLSEHPAEPAPPTKEVSTVGFTLDERPAISGGMGWFTINPGLVQFPFWASNKKEHENNKYAWYDDKDVNEAKERAELFLTAVNTHDSLVSALKEAMEIIDRLSEDVSTLSGKHSSYSQGEHRRLSKALNAATTK